jgi:hypothetical protein
MMLEESKLGKRRSNGPRQKSKKELLALSLKQTATQVDNSDPYDALDTMRPDGVRARMRHETSRKIVMFKPLDNGRVGRKEVPSANLQMLMEGGWLWECPDCGTDCYDDPNECPGRAPRKYRECNICDARFYDPGDNKMQKEAVDDSNKIVDDADAKATPSTPEARTLQMLQWHIAAYHPEEAAARGLGQLVVQLNSGK